MKVVQVKRSKGAARFSPLNYVPFNDDARAIVESAVGHAVEYDSGGPGPGAEMLSGSADASESPLAANEAEIPLDLVSEAALKVADPDAVLAESKLFRTKQALKRYDARDITDLVMVCCLVLKVLRHDYRYMESAGKYAARTINGSANFQGWRSSGTDLYVAAAIVRDGSTMRWMLKDDSQYGFQTAKRIFSNMKFSIADFKRYLGNIASKRRDDNFDKAYLMRLERQMKIEDARIKRWRRMACNWPRLSHRERTMLVLNMLQETRSRWPFSELRPLLAEFVQMRSYVLDPADAGSSPKKHELAKKLVVRPAAAAGLGYALGRLAGS